MGIKGTHCGDTISQSLRYNDAPCWTESGCRAKSIQPFWDPKIILPQYNQSILGVELVERIRKKDLFLGPENIFWSQAWKQNMCFNGGFSTSIQPSLPECTWLIQRVARQTTTCAGICGSPVAAQNQAFFIWLEKHWRLGTPFVLTPLSIRIRETWNLRSKHLGI